MLALVALLPLALILLLMVGWRWSAAAAGAVGATTAIAVAVVAFDYQGAGAVGLLPSLGGLMAEAAFLSLSILWIVFPALCLHELQVRSGATDVLRRGLAQLTDDPRLAALLVAFFFALFFEGAAGFGTPVALAAPLLVGLGFTPVRALTLALIGHSIGVSFGAVGTPIFVQAGVGGLTLLDLSATTALLHALLGWTMALWVYRIAGEGHRQLRGGITTLTWPLLASALFAVPSWWIAAYVGPELPTLAAALLGGAAFALFVRWRGREAGRDAGGGPAADDASMVRAHHWLRAGLPYLLLLVIILATRLVVPVRESLSAPRWSWELFAAFRGEIQPLYHPGTALMLCFLLGGVLRGTPAKALLQAAVGALRRLPKVLLALIAMLALARIMLHAGMIDVVALALAASLGGAWPLIAPAIGAVGTFVTGSATASNILLTDLQRATADALEMPMRPLIAAQGFGAAVGNIICPHNIVAGGATVGLIGREGEVMRRTLPACLVYAALGGLVVFAMVRIGG